MPGDKVREAALLYVERALAKKGHYLDAVQSDEEWVARVVVAEGRAKKGAAGAKTWQVLYEIHLGVDFEPLYHVKRGLWDKPVPESAFEEAPAGAVEEVPLEAPLDGPPGGVPELAESTVETEGGPLAGEPGGLVDAGTADAAEEGASMGGESPAGTDVTQAEEAGQDMIPEAATERGDLEDEPREFEDLQEEGDAEGQEDLVDLEEGPREEPLEETGPRPEPVKEEAGPSRPSSQETQGPPRLSLKYVSDEAVRKVDLKD